ncbi:hypothetical protein PUR_38520 [Paenibacillus sp. URB8-2]|nr:hypothetical protein PUR_38520 [Paenibacillus sp. URB8-2]
MLGSQATARPFQTSHKVKSMICWKFRLLPVAIRTLAIKKFRTTDMSKMIKNTDMNNISHDGHTQHDEI